MDHPPISIPKQNTALAPLVVDLDGTLTLIDTLIESIVQVLKHNPLNALKFPLWLLKGRAAFKEFIASKSSLSVENLPYHLALLDYLRGEKAKGRRVILATAAHRNIADRVAKYLDIFDTVLASDGTKNLKGTTKLDAIRASVGDNFVYAGDSAADLPIWKAATAAILVGVSAGVSATVRQSTLIDHEFPREDARLRTWLRAL